MKKFILFLACGFLLLAASFGAQAQQEGHTPLPELPVPIQNLIDEGAQIRYLGREYGLDSWLTIKNGQEQYFYVLPDRSAFVMGVLFNADGKMVTLDQVQRLRSQGDTLLDQLASDFSDTPQTNATKAESTEFKSPAEQLFTDLESSNWVALGQEGVPVIYSFIDPQCPHCHAFINDLRPEYLAKNQVQLRMIPVGFKDETRAQAAYLIAAPNPQETWFKHMGGDKNALPAQGEINQQGVQRNLAIMQAWKFDVTPLIVYRAKDGSVKIVQGRPKDLAAMIADISTGN